MTENVHGGMLRWWQYARKRPIGRAWRHNFGQTWGRGINAQLYADHVQQPRVVPFFNHTSITACSKIYKGNENKSGLSQWGFQSVRTSTQFSIDGTFHFSSCTVWITDVSYFECWQCKFTEFDNMTTCSIWSLNGSQVWNTLPRIGLGKCSNSFFFVLSVVLSFELKWHCVCDFSICHPSSSFIVKSSQSMWNISMINPLSV